MEDQVHATSMFWYDFPMFVGFSNHLIVKPYNKITRVSPMLRNPLFKAIINLDLQLLIFLLEILHNKNLATDTFKNNFSKVYTLLNWLLRITPTKQCCKKLFKIQNTVGTTFVIAQWFVIAQFVIIKRY